MKLAQRLGLVFLVPRLAPWRYVRSMADISGALAGTRADAQSQPDPSLQPDSAQAPKSKCEQPEIELAEEVEEVMGRLLQGLRDRDTIVRWSAAKGVGRLTGCLDQELGEDVVASVLDLFRPTEGDAAWHGGCLALAELARRGLLLPGHLPSVTPIIAAALEYDVRRGPHSIGAHVRDAAAYVCWAFARAYAPELLVASAEVLGGCLMATACYDREVNCRRAAASAYQECVGRLGVLAHGIEVLAVADFYSVGNTHEAYLRVAPAVAAYPEYRPHLARHLLSLKLRHWDKAVRSLAARGLAALVATDPAHFATSVLDELLPQCFDAVLEVRLGAVLGVAELLPALASARQVLTPERAEAVAQLLPQFEANRAYRGKGGELMRDAAARLLERMAAAELGVQGRAVPGALSISRASTPEQRQQQQGQQQGASGTDAAPSSLMQSADAASTAAGMAAQDGEGFAAAQPSAGHGAHEWRLPLNEAQHRAALALIDDCLRHVLEGTRAAGCAALAAYARAYGPKAAAGRAAAVATAISTDGAASAAASAAPAAPAAAGLTAAGAPGGSSGEAAQPGPADSGAAAPAAAAAVGLQKLMSSCLARLQPGPTEPHVRRGAAMALGAFPASIAAARAAEVISVLVAAAAPSEKGAGPEGDEVDVESRTHAVRSLGQLCQELYTLGRDAAASGNGSSTSGSADAKTTASGNGACAEEAPTASTQPSPAAQAAPATGAAATAAGGTASAPDGHAAAGGTSAGDSTRAAWPLLARQVLPCLLHAMGDYTTDNRGDVGSWVREAAMEELPRCLLLLRQAEQAAGGPERGRAGCAGLAVAGVGWLLRQALERIARVRETAMRQLRVILEHAQLSQDVPHAAQLLAALPSDATLVTGVASLDSITAMGALLALPLPDYQAPLLEGLVASIGGVDAWLAKAAGSALLGALPSSGGRNVGQLLLALWEREARSARLATPLIRTCHLLLTKADTALLDPPATQQQPNNAATAAANGAPAGAPSADAAAAVGSAGLQPAVPAAAAAPSFAAGVLVLLKGELRQCGDVGRLLEGATLAAHLVGMPGCKEAAMQSILVLLVNRFPKVRRHTAEQLYLVLLAEEAEEEEADDGDGDASTGPAAAQQEPPLSTSESREAALDLLLSTPWDGPLEGARAGRDELAALLGLVVKSKPVVRRGKAAGAAARQDENASYQALLDDAARGGGY